MAYRADIEIAVRGAQELKRLQNEIKSSSDAVNSLNSSLNAVANLLPRSFNNLNRLVSEAATEFNKVALGTQEATDAARLYARATDELNTGLRERVQLLKQVREEDRKARLAASGIREATQYAEPIGPGQASPVALRSELRGRTQQILDERRGRVELNAVLQDQFELERQLQNSKLDEKAAQVQAELDKQAAAAAESAAQVDKLTARQEDFMRRTDAAAQAAARQTAEFYRQARAAKEVAKINAVAGPAQLLLAPAALGAPAMGGGARRRITGAVERLGGARTADEAAATLRLAQATDALVQSSSKIDPQYNRFLPDTAALNAVGRGIQRLTTNQEEFNQTVQRGIRFEEKYNQELERRQRLGIGGPVSNRMPGTTGVTTGPFPVEGPIPLSEFGRREVARSRRAGLSNRVGGAISGSIIGGAFPLLFGQGGGAAAGGAVGGLVGGLAGPGGSFAGSLLGTLLGDIASRGQAVKQLGEDLGFSAAQAATLADAFKTANTDVEKFTAVIQNIRGVGLELEEQATAVQLVTALTEKYGGSFEKVGNAVTSALESGKVSQAVLNQLTSQGITVQDALAAKYDVSRDKILEMAKSGEISVQSLLDTLVELGNASTTAAEKTQTPFEKALSTTGQLFQRFWKDVQAIFAGVSSNGVEAGTSLLNIFNKLLEEALLPLGRFLARIAALFVDVLSTGVRAAEELINGFRGVVSTIGDALMGIVNMIPGLRTIVNLARQLFKGATGSKSSDWNDMPWPEGIPKPGSPGMIGNITAPSQALPSGGGGGTKGPKPPEDRTAQLKEDLNAMRLISKTEDGIRDALSEGNKALAIRLEYDQKVHDINRDTAKALLNANYETEKAVIRAQQIVRLKDAELVKQDQLRALTIEQSEALNARNPLETLQQEIDLLAAKLQGKEAEYKRQQAIDAEVKKGVALQDAIANIDAITQLNALLQERIELEQLAATVGQGMGDALTNVFDALIARTENFNNVLRNTLASLGRFLMMAGLNALADIGDPSGQGTGILSFLGFGKGFGKRAGGGAVTTNAPYLVGERGPELFVPGTGGSVVPTNDLRAAMGSAPGSSGGPVLNMSFETTNIAGVEYVSREQLEQAMAATRRQAASDGAKRGMSMTLDRIQQSPQTRNRLGIR